MCFEDDDLLARRGVADGQLAVTFLEGVLRTEGQVRLVAAVKGVMSMSRSSTVRVSAGLGFPSEVRPLQSLGGYSPLG